jgi:hypothetical protein
VGITQKNTTRFANLIVIKKTLQGYKGAAKINCIPHQLALATSALPLEELKKHLLQK